MYKDMISYELADGVTEEQLLTAAKDIVENWMQQLPGFLGWEITKTNEGGYVDIVHWESREAAKNAENEMANIPNAANWYACYKPGSIKNTPVHVVNAWK